MEIIKLINTNDNSTLAKYEVNTAKESKKISTICKPIIGAIAPHIKIETESYIDENIVSNIVSDIISIINANNK